MTNQPGRAPPAAPAGAAPSGDAGDRADPRHPASPAPAAPMVARRLVIHVAGYDPTPPEAVHRRFARELRRFEGTWSVTAAAAAPRVEPDEASWRVEAAGPNWWTRAEVRLLRWDDLIEADRHRPVWLRLADGLRAVLDFLAGGAFWGYLRTNWRYAGFFAYPMVLLAGLVALAVAAGALARAGTGSGPAGLVVGLAVLAALVPWGGGRLRLFELLDDWAFARRVIRRPDSRLEARLDRAADALVGAARGGGFDEILVVGHSLGAVIAADLLDRALRRAPDLGAAGPRIAFLSVGSSILKIGLHRAAGRLRETVARLSAREGLFWADFQALSDVMNFYKVDPVAAMGLPPRGSPLVRVVRLSRMLDPAAYRRMRLNFFRLHCQFVSANDRRAPYDYFMLVCGPLPVERQARSRDGAVAAFGPDGSLLDDPGPPEPRPAPPAP